VSIDPNTPAQVTLNVFYDGRHHLAFGYNALMLLSYSGGVYIFSGVRRQRHGRARHKLFAREVLLERRTRRRLSPESPVRLAHLSRRSEPLTFRNFGSEIIADNLKKRGWTWGCVSSVDSEGRTIWIGDAHRDDGKRFIVRAEEILTAFLELEGGDSVFVGGLKIDHRWPQCDAHGLIMKLEIRSTGE